MLKQTLGRGTHVGDFSKQFNQDDTRRSSTEKPEPVLSIQQLQTLFEEGEREFVKSYVKKHLFGVAMQEWLMCTRDVDLIETYLHYHGEVGLFEGAEEMLMGLKNRKLRKLYLEKWRLRPSSILWLFAEKDYGLLFRYVVRHPEETFSQTALYLMFEANNKRLIALYVQYHPSILHEGRFTGMLSKMGFECFVSGEA